MKEVRDVLLRRSSDDAEFSPVVGTFLRGLSLGALVGAAIAGSTLLQRRRRQAPPPTGADRAEEGGASRTR